MNRADAIDLDSESKKKECTKCLGRNIDLLEYEARKGKRATEDLVSKEFQMKKGLFLLEIIDKSPGSKPAEDAEEKLLEIIHDL